MVTTNDEVVIRVDHLHKRYGDKVAVDDVSFEVRRGEIFGILGPNGAGKTTTVECIEGLRRANAGSIEVLGLDPASQAPLLHERIGGQLQSAGLPDKLRVGEALELFAAFYPDPIPPRRLAERLGLDGRWSTKWKSLSGGQQQRLSIALALIGRPEIIILRDDGVTVVLLTHLMEEAERLCDRVAVIDEGRIAAVTGTAGLIAAGGLTAQRLRFVPSGPVDDHPVVRDGLCGMFSSDPDFEVVGQAGDGAVGVAMATTLVPDVILMDLRMPGTDGLSAITEIVRLGLASHVLVLTTYDTDGDVLPAIEAGATGYLLKDARRADLFHAVRAAARGETALSPTVAARLVSRVRGSSWRSLTSATTSSTDF